MKINFNSLYNGNLSPITGQKICRQGLAPACVFSSLKKNPARYVLFFQHRNKLVGRNLPFFILRACVLIKGDFFLNRR